MPHGVHQQDGADYRTSRRQTELEMPAGRHSATWGLRDIRGRCRKGRGTKTERISGCPPQFGPNPTGDHFHLTVRQPDPTSSRTDGFYGPSARDSANLVIQQFPISTFAFRQNHTPATVSVQAQINAVPSVHQACRPQVALPIEMMAMARNRIPMPLKQ